MVWVKRRWECRVASCPRKTFTESLPGIPPRCRVTSRLRDHAGRLVAEGGRTVTQAARECGLSWPVTHAAFAERADPLLEQPPAPVAHLGIDEHRRGRPVLPMMRAAGSMCCWLTAGTPVSLTCPGIRGCWYARRGRSGDAEYGIKGLLVRNLEHLRPEQFAKVMDTLSADRHGQEIAAAWIGKEKLRDVLNLRARVTRSAPCERDVRGRLASFYDWCAQNDDVPELLTLARTISKWEDEIVAAILTGVTNARSEALNRVAKLEARMAYSFRNPASQRRRVRIACTRTTRRSRIATPRRSRQVTGRRPDPG